MSVISATAHSAAQAAAPATGWAKPKRESPRRQSAVIPRSQPAIRTLMIAMSVMCYLASLAIGGLILINRAVDSWTTDMAREVTVQVRPLEGHDLETELARAADVISGFDGITRVRILDRDSASKLLEPWLGRSQLIENLPVPRLITVAVDRQNPPDLDRLASALRAEVAGVSLDTHRHWQRELTRLAEAVQWLGFAILLLVLFSAVTLVIQVTRTALEANREAVEVLYLVGAKDRFIASAVERRFLGAGMTGSIAGAVLGIATFAAVTFAGYAAAPSGLAEASRSLVFGPTLEATIAYLAFLLVPIVATLICLVTARLAVLKILRQAF
jgi:cell division transport system permease protein